MGQMEYVSLSLVGYEAIRENGVINEFPVLAVRERYSGGTTFPPRWIPARERFLPSTGFCTRSPRRSKRMRWEPRTMQTRTAAES